MDDRTSSPPEMNIKLDRGSSVPLYRQLEGSIRELILAGRLPPGCHLLSERAMAKRLGVNRTTVVNAYAELAAAGLVEGRVGEGTVVLGPAPQPEEELAAVPLAWGGLIGSRARWLSSPLLRRVSELAARPGTISFASGSPEEFASPELNLGELMQRLLADGGQELLQDSPSEGLPALRAAVGKRLALRGCRDVGARQVIILSGSQQGLYLVARLLLEPGDAVLVEAPTYLGALQVFRAVGARLVGVPVDEEGMQVDLAERYLAHAGIRLIYTIPNFQNPTGATMSGARRARLLSLAQRYQVPILEDDQAGELYYGTGPLPPIRALDRGGYVLYMGGLSSVLGPGLRLGWLVAPSAAIEPLVALRQAIDLYPNNLAQAIVQQLLQDQLLEPHLEWQRRLYASRRDCLLAALERYMPASVSWSRPEGGFYLCCYLPEGMSARALLEEAAGQGVVFVPGEAFSADGRGEGFIRINFAHPEAEVEEGVRRLARAIKRLQGRGQESMPEDESQRLLV